MKRENIGSGSHFEEAYGYSRAVAVGDTIYVAGTIGMDYGARQMSPDPAEQTRQSLRNIEAALARLGSSLKDLVQITTFVDAGETFEKVGPVLGEVLGGIRPTNAALVVGFPFPDIKVEIQAIAVRGCGG
ncbi:RidA family protein [Futiania mangrovi]|uniref:RidA family protein n=1 Tax=Futiania mangrovi TaxID=2959716 RepID=A0A9J6PGM5_9PROT|nr:RidA family protein [Futiania mangrovii]MCP1335751.1 RidA family protein [Futiania mangrovii]